MVSSVHDAQDEKNVAPLYQICSCFKNHLSMVEVLLATRPQQHRVISGAEKHAYFSFLL